MTEISGAMNILTAAASRRGIGRLFRRFCWCYIQTERRESYIHENQQKSMVVEHDTWSRIFGCCSVWRPPIEMRIQRIRSRRDKGTSIYVICEPLREVPIFEAPKDIPNVFHDLKSAKESAAKLVKAIRQCPAEKQKELASEEVSRWQYTHRPPRKGWNKESR